MFIDKDLLIKKYNIIIKRLLVLKLLRLTDGLLFGFITVTKTMYHMRTLDEQALDL